MPQTRQQILKLADDCTGNGRVDVIKLATKLGIDVYAVESKDEDYNAEIEYDKGSKSFKIYVNENHPETRRRFSIAHEISHYALDSAELKRRGKLDRSAAYVDDEHRDREQNADQFAAEILMPEPKVKKYLSEKGVGELAINSVVISELSKYFHVSKGMAITRLRNMGYPIPYLTFA
jgi:Zn-dependent peptidase ImmA (M78 family)